MSLCLRTAVCVLIILQLSGPCLALVENWNLPTSESFSMYSNPNSGSPTSGVPDSGALDGHSLKLTLFANPPPGVRLVEVLQLKQRVNTCMDHTGLEAETANCASQPNAGVVTGFFTYYNDGSDGNGNGLPDNSELDFEWLCARPEVVHLSIWTDYLEADPPQIRVVYRSINIRTGAILMECYRESFGECQPLATAEKQPTTLTPLPTYDPVNKYYEYGFILEATRLQFVLLADDQTYVLWDYQGPTSRIPSHPMHFMHNVWHTNNWYPIDDPNGEAVEPPNSEVNVYVDRSRFIAF